MGKALNPLRIYDYLTRSRQRVLDAARPLTAAQHDREFSIGLGTLSRTLAHIMICEWGYVRRIQGRDIPPAPEFPLDDENPPPFADLEAAWAAQADETRSALAAVGDWSAPIEFRRRGEDGRAIVVTASAADLFTQLALHEVHHRAQALNILRHLGVTLHEDIDFNALMYDRRVV